MAIFCLASATLLSTFFLDLSDVFLPKFWRLNYKPIHSFLVLDAIPQRGLDSKVLGVVFQYLSAVLDDFGLVKGAPGCYGLPSPRLPAY